MGFWTWEIWQSDWNPQVEGYYNDGEGTTYADRCEDILQLVDEGD